MQPDPALLGDVEGTKEGAVNHIKGDDSTWLDTNRPDATLRKPCAASMNRQHGPKSRTVGLSITLVPIFASVRPQRKSVRCWTETLDSLSLPELSSEDRAAMIGIPNTTFGG